MKLCKKCNIEKESGDFPLKRQKKKDGKDYTYLGYMCKVCTNKDKYQRRKSNPESYEKLLKRTRARVKKAYDSNPELSKLRATNWKDEHVKNGTYKSKWLISKYKITINEYRNIEQLQNYSCAICGIHEDEYRKTYKKSFAVDHCHITRKVRALLCHKCNLYVGQIEKLELFEKALAYLTKHKDKETLGVFNIINKYGGGHISK
jgi:hypothetical protein